MSRPALKVVDGALADVVLPASREAEAGLVATALTLAEVVPVAEHVGLQPAAFYHADLRAAWEAIVEVQRDGAAVDELTVVSLLQRQGKFDELGGMPWLMQVVGQQQATTMNVRALAEEVKFLWERRTLHAVSMKLREFALEGVEDRAAWVREVSDLGSRLISLGQRERRKTVGEHIADVMALVRGMIAGKVDKSRWVFSSLPTFNKNCKPYNSGIQDDGLVLVGGQSGTGKSVYLRQEAHAALAQSVSGHVLFISAETGTGGLCAMMAASAVGVDLNRIEDEPADRQRLYEAELERMQAEWADKRLFVVQHEDGRDMTCIEDAVEMVRVHVQRYGVPMLICVDYLQLFESRDKSARTREQVVGKVSSALQKLQRTLKCVVMVAAQLNRSGLDDAKSVKRDPETNKVIHRLPDEGNLRESSRMYHDADRVIFLYRPPVDCRDQDQTAPNTARPEVWIYQQKRRSGGIYSVRTWFEKKYTRFVELSRTDLLESQGVAPAGAVEQGAPMKKSDWLKQQKGGA